MPATCSSRSTTATSRASSQVGEARDGIRTFPRKPSLTTPPPGQPQQLPQSALPAVRDAEILALQTRLSQLEALVHRDEEVLRKLLALLIDKRVATRDEILERIREAMRRLRGIAIGVVAVLAACGGDRSEPPPPPPAPTAPTPPTPAPKMTHDNFVTPRKNHVDGAPTDLAAVTTELCSYLGQSPPTRATRSRPARRATASRSAR